MVPSVSVQQGLTVNIKRSIIPYLNSEKLRGGRGITRKERSTKNHSCVLPCHIALLCMKYHVWAMLNNIKTQIRSNIGKRLHA